MDCYSIRDRCKQKLQIAYFYPYHPWYQLKEKLTNTVECINYI